VERADPASAVTSAGDDAAGLGDGAAMAAGGNVPSSGRAWSGRGRLAPSVRPEWLRLARKTAYRGLVLTGRPARRARMLPGFLIAGAERCGTTSMYHVLKQHPAVFGTALRKQEVHFFDVAYDRGLAWYQAQFPLAVSARLAARGTGVAPVAFEASPYYMFHPLAPERIHRDLPGVRLLVLLRDPVERAYSAHANHVGHGLETESFERALELEDSRLAGETERIIADPSYNSYSHRHHSYRIRGQYVDQLEHLERIFGRARILVVDSDDFFAEPGPVYDQVLEFLRLPPHPPAFTPQNARPRAPMPATVRAALEEHYRPYDERLTAWLGREPSWCRQTPHRSREEAPL
jgi:Sulfotransferase domain